MRESHLQCCSKKFSCVRLQSLIIKLPLRKRGVPSGTQSQETVFLILGITIMTTDMASPVETTSGHLWPPRLALAHYNITQGVPWLSARAGSAG